MCGLFVCAGVVYDGKGRGKEKGRKRGGVVARLCTRIGSSVIV